MYVIDFKLGDEVLETRAAKSSPKSLAGYKAAATPAEQDEFKNDNPTVLDRVRDHCHVTGEYRGAAHNSCNLRAKTSYTVPVFVHNLKGYDAHLLFQEMEQVGGNISVIATNIEK